MQDADDQQEGDLASSVVEFTYPALCIDDHLASTWSWSSTPSLTDIMTPLSEGQSDDNSSSLGDSAYEILGDSTVLTSDDEDRDDATDSASSVGAHGPDDVTSVAGTEHSEDSNASGHQLDTPGITPARSEHASEAEDVNSSHVTITNPTADEGEVIRLEEQPEEPGSTTMIGFHIMQIFDEAETSKLWKDVLRSESSPPKTLLGTVRLRMSREVLAMEEPLRIWYAGEAEVKDAIIAKLAAALAAPMWTDPQPRTTAIRRRSSRFSVVPVSSFGDRGAPEVELIDSMGLELAVDDCTSSRYVSTPLRVSLDIQLNGTTWCSSRRGPNGLVYEAAASRPLPHLVVIVDEDPNSQTDVDFHQTRCVLKAVASFHRVPVLCVASAPIYTTRSYADFAENQGGPYACLEVLSQPPGHNRPMRRASLDLATFSRIDALQLNRHLAYLMARTTSSVTATTSRRTVRQDVDAHAEDVEKSSWKTAGWTGKGPRIRHLKRHARPAWLLLSVFLVCALMGTTSTLMYRQFGSKSASTSPDLSRPTVLSTVKPVKTSLTRTTTATAGSCMASSARQTLSTIGKSLSTQPQTPNSLTVPYSSKELGLLLGDPMLTTLNQSDEYQLQVIGDCHIIVRPPKKISSLMKRAPPLSVSVKRNGQPIPVELSKPFEGVYAIKLCREDAWGVMNVTVATTSKDQQHLTADFGTPWLKMVEWQRAANNMARRFQDGFSQWPPWMSINISSIVRPPVRRSRPSRLSKISRQNYSWAVVTRAAQQVSSAVQRQRAVLSADLAAVDDFIHDVITEKRDQAAQMAEKMQRWTDQARATQTRLSKTFTVPRARKQAGRIWARVWQYRDGMFRRRTTPVKGSQSKGGDGKGCSGRKTCRRSFMCGGWRR